MRLLLLGGPKFVGRAVIDAALERGHEVTLFNRGATGADLYPELTRVRGDRDGGLDGLRGGEWDAVVDTSGYLPRLVGDSARLLADAAGHYVFVSSISVYASFAEVVDEQAPLAELSTPGSEDIATDYGALKALCERAVEEAFAGRATAVRAGLIVGPHDPTGRFTYWPHRVARGGDVLVPGPAWRPIQLVDVRDLAAWIVTAAEERLAGPFNATGPATMGAVIDAARRASNSEARAVEVDDPFLTGQGVGEWMELPLWIDTSNEDWRHFMEVDASRAVAAGLTFRPLDETVAGALAEAGLVEGVGLTPDAGAGAARDVVVTRPRRAGRRLASSHGDVRAQHALQRHPRPDGGDVARAVGVLLPHVRRRLALRAAGGRRDRALRRAHALQGHRAPADRTGHRDRDRHDRRRVQRLHGEGAHGLLREVRRGDARRRARRARRHAAQLTLRRRRDRA